MSQGLYPNENLGFRQIWRDNHGNFLLAFTGLILLIGGTILIWPKKEKNRIGAEILSENGIPLLEEEAASEQDTNTSAYPPVQNAEATDVEQTLLRIRVVGINSTEGNVLIAAYTDPSTFNNPDSTLLKTSLPANDEVVWEVNVPTGTDIALSVFHDANANGKLDRNLIGIPSEKYGFSQGARSQLGPPPFIEASFNAESGVIEVPIEIW